MATLKNNNRLIARNSVLLSIRMVIVLLIGIYTSRVLLEILGVEDFGTYNVVCGFVAMFAFLNTSMNNGIQRFYNYKLGKEGETGARKVYHCSIVTQAVIAIAIFILTETIGLWYVYNKLVVSPERLQAAIWVFHSSVISLLLLIIQVPYSAAIMAHEKMDYYAACSVIDIVLKLLIVLALPYLGHDYLITYGILMVGISVLDFFLFYIYALSRFPELKGSFKFDRMLLNEMVIFSGWNLFGSFSGVMKEQGLNVLLNLFFGPVVNAARGLAYQVSGGVQSFIINITTAARPQLTQSYAQGNIARTMNIMFSMSKMSYICLYMFALPVMLESDFLLDLWLGGNVPEHTSMFVVLIIGFTLINVFNPPISFVVHATGKMRNYQLITSIVSLLLLPTSYFVLLYGLAPEVVFVLNIIFMIAVQVVSVFLLRSLVEFSITSYMREVILRCLLMSFCAAVLPFLIRCIMCYGLSRLLLVSLVCAICVSILSYIIVFNQSERELVSNYVLKIINR